MLVNELEEDDESEYGVRGSRRKGKANRKIRGRSSATRGSKRVGASVRGSSARGAKAKGRKKAADDEDEDFINDGDVEGGAAGELLDEDDDAAGEDEDGADVERSGAKGEETVFIDNLPNDEYEIRAMLKEVKKHIKLLEKQFFEEEDSEKEEDLKQISNITKHEEALAAFKQHANLKQFWCIPLSVNVTSFNFSLLAESQLKNGGRLFDVITIDPPW